MPLDPKDLPLARATDEVLQVIHTLVEALKTQPGFQPVLFEAVIRNRLLTRNLGHQAQAALLRMLEDPWEE